MSGTAVCLERCALRPGLVLLWTQRGIIGCSDATLWTHSDPVLPSIVHAMAAAVVSDVLFSTGSQSGVSEKLLVMYLGASSEALEEKRHVQESVGSPAPASGPYAAATSQ